MELSQLNPVDTTTLQARVYASLRDIIANGQVKPGDVFTIRAIATRMGTSVMPVREAVTRLHAEGAVDIRLPSRQIRVPVLSREAVAELYAVRIALEGMAAAMAAAHVNETELAGLERSVAEMDAAIGSGDEMAFLLANRSFHFTIYKAARSQHLLPMIESLWLKFGPLLRVPLGPGSRAESRVMGGGQHRHEEAVDALHARDAEAVKAAIQGDLADTAAWFAEHYDPEAYCVTVEHEVDAD